MPEDLQELVLSDDLVMARLLMKYREFDRPKEPIGIFTQWLLSRDAWFVEAGEQGLIFLTNIIPYLSADLHMIFWDKKLTGDRRECAQHVVKAAFQLFNLSRVTGVATEPNKPLRKIYKSMSFKEEGIIRKAKVVNNQVVDVYIYGILKEEATWPTQKTSLV
jgi:hypothetical protein